MTNQSTFDDIIEIKIDEEKLYRLTDHKGTEMKETDPNTIIIEMNDTRLARKVDTKPRWNTKNKKG